MQRQDPTSDANENLVAAPLTHQNPGYSRQLLEEKADVNHISMKYRYGDSPLAPLMSAVVGNAPEIAKLLLDNKANPNYRFDLLKKDTSSIWGSPNYWTPLTVAASTFYPLQSFKTLVEKKADINLPTSHGETALMLAASCPDREKVKFLLDRKAEINVSDKKKNTPIMNAAKSNNLSNVKMLLDSKARVTVTPSSSFFDRSLAQRARADKSEIIRLLLLFKDFQQASIVFLFGLSDACKKKEEKLKKGEKNKKPNSLQIFKSNLIFDPKLVGLLFSYLKPSILEENWNAFYKLVNRQDFLKDIKEKLSELKTIYDQIITDKKDRKNTLLQIALLKNKIQAMVESHDFMFPPLTPSAMGETQGEINNRVTDLLDSLDNLKQTLISQVPETNHSMLSGIR